MSVEAAVALWSGTAAHSLALVAFGFDSVIELASAGVLIWRLTVEIKGLTAQLLFHLWWLDRATSLAITYCLVKEGREAWIGDDCC